MVCPVELPNGAVFESLTFREMKARDTLIAEDSDSEIMAGYKLFATLADVEVEVILELCIEDLNQIGKATASLMGKSYEAELMGKLKKVSAGET